MLSDEQLKQIFTENSVIAIVGAKDKAGSPVEHVGRYLIDKGYEILPVHPVRQNIWGLPTYKSLEDLPKMPDIICFFRTPDACLEHAREIIALSEKMGKPNVFWMQLGISNSEVARLFAENGLPDIVIVEDKCMEVEYERVFGN